MIIFNWNFVVIPAIFKLNMTENVYQNPSIAQNSVDNLSEEMSIYRTGKSRSSKENA